MKVRFLGFPAVGFPRGLGDTGITVLSEAAILAIHGQVDQCTVYLDVIDAARKPAHVRLGQLSRRTVATT